MEKIAEDIPFDASSTKSKGQRFAIRVSLLSVALAFVYAMLWKSYFIHAWWRFLPTTIAATLIFAFVFRGRADSILGLRIHWKAALVCVGLTSLFYWFATLLIPFALRGTEVTYDAYPFEWYSLLVTPFQVLNEEMLLRAALLYAISRIFSNSLGISLLVGLLFALLHFMLHGIFDDHRLALSTIFSLFAFATIGNYVFLRTGHIGYTFAFHTGWNLARFTNGELYDSRTFESLNQPQSFDALEGSTTIATINFVVLSLVLLYAYRAGTRVNLNLPQPILVGDKQSVRGRST